MATENVYLFYDFVIYNYNVKLYEKILLYFIKMKRNIDDKNMMVVKKYKFSFFKVFLFIPVLIFSNLDG